MKSTGDLQEVIVVSLRKNHLESELETKQKLDCQEPGDSQERVSVGEMGRRLTALQKADQDLCDVEKFS